MELETERNTKRGGASNYEMDLRLPFLAQPAVAT